MLTKIRLENFKSWRELDLDLSNLTILFGTNSSGKSSVLQSLLLLKQTAMGFGRSEPINLGSYKQGYVDFGSYRDLVFGHDEDKPVGVHLEWLADVASDSILGPTGYQKHHSFAIRKIAYTVHWQQLGERIVVKHVDYDVLSPEDVKLFIHMKWQEQNVYTFTVPDEFKRSPELQEKIHDEIGGEPSSTVLLESCYAIPLSDYGLDFYPTEFSKQFEALIKRIAYLGPLRSYPERIYSWKGTAPQQIGPNGSEAIDVLVASERGADHVLEQVSKWLKQMKLVAEFQIRPIDPNRYNYETRIGVTDNSIKSSLVDVGFGISQVLPIITLLYFVPQGSIVLLEQPELHLHPSAQAQLADLFLDVAEKRGLQLIVESHSEHLLRRLQRRIAEQEYKFATPEHIKMYFCEIEHGESTLHSVKVDEYGQIANWPKDFFGDISGDLDAMTDAALERRRQELLNNDRSRR